MLVANPELFSDGSPRPTLRIQKAYFIRFRSKFLKFTGNIIHSVAPWLRNQSNIQTTYVNNKGYFSTFPFTRAAKLALMNKSIFPSSTPCVSLVSTFVRKSFTIWYGCST